MVGLSFGARWSTRMAARDGRLKAVVSNGGLYHRSFQPAATFGMPEIMLWTLQQTTGGDEQPRPGAKAGCPLGQTPLPGDRDPRAGDQR